MSESDKPREMTAERIYSDSQGNECSLETLVRREPDWAASRIRVGEQQAQAIERVRAVRDHLAGMVKDVTPQGDYEFGRQQVYDFAADELSAALQDEPAEEE